MAFRKVLALALLCSAANGAPQTLVHSPLVRTVATHSASPFIRTVAHSAALPAATVVRHSSLEHSAPLVQQVRAVSHATHAVPAVQQTFIRAAQPSVVTHATHAVPALQRTVAQVVAHPAIHEEVEVVDANPNYSFGYSVADARSGDSKTREETRDGDVVTGSYSVADPDGRIRRVEYTADKYNGFQATVTYDGESGPPAIPFNAPTAAAASVIDVAEPADSAVVIAGRDNTEEEDAAETRDNTANQATVTRFIQPAGVQAFRTFQPASFIHAAPAGTIVRSNLVHQAAAPTVVRAFPSVAHPAVVRADATHLVHNSAVAQPTVVRSFANAPFAHSPFALRALPVGTQFVHA